MKGRGVRTALRGCEEEAGEGRRRGPKQDIAPKKVCHAVSKLPPKLWGILLPVQKFEFECSLACFGCMPVPHLPRFWLWN